MSYADLSKEELLEIADMYNVDTDESDSEQTLLNKVSTLNVAEVLLDFPQFADKLALPADDDEDDDEEPAALVTSDNTPKRGAKKMATKKPMPARKTSAAKPASSTPVVGEDRTLIKMTRNNPVYEVRGYRFTRNMPFVFVKNEDIDFLIEVEGGFTVAKPAEVESFFN